MSLFPIIPPFVAPVTVSFIEDAVDLTDLTAYTFAATAFGSPTLDAGKLLLGITGRRGGGTSPNGGISTVTESGNSCALVKAQGSDANVTELWQLHGRSAGALGSIVITFVNDQNKCMVTLALMKDAAEAAAATASSTANPLSASLAIPASGAAVGVANNADTGTATWTNLTEVVDADSGETMSYTMAQKAVTAAETPTIECQWSAGVTSSNMCLAAWTPA